MMLSNNESLIQKENKMNIDALTIGQLKQLKAIVGDGCQDDSHWEVGENYFIRTVTMIYTGRLVKVTQSELVIEDAAWIADTGRFATALKTGEFNEVEPYPDGHPRIIGRGAILDAGRFEHVLPRSQK